MSRLFLYRPGALGDTLLLAPALAALRACPEGTETALAGHDGATRLLAASGLVDTPLSGDDPLLAPLFGSGGDLRPLSARLGTLDAAVAWLADRDGLVALNLRRLGARQVVVCPSQPAPGDERHVADYLLDTLVAAGLAGAERPPLPALRVPADDVVWAAACLSRQSARATRVVAVHPGSGGARKNWAPERFAAVMTDLARDYDLLLLGGPADTEALAAVEALIGARWPVARDLPLPRVAALLSRCGAFLGNDSGLTHLAALLGVPTVALFGPTDPRRWRPLGLRVSVLSWAAGPQSLSPDDVARAVRAAMAG